ncbi:hypothetical protein [Streptomyces canus]|uniref:hypothetical protein n=1 Tax=Streptomyces canus TaxID=58343 RepID=UPI0036E20DF8
MDVGSARTPGNRNTHAYAYDARTRVITELDSPVGPNGTGTAVGISEGRYVTGTWDHPDTVRGRPRLRPRPAHPGPDRPEHLRQRRLQQGHLDRGVWSGLGPEMSYRPIMTGHTVLATRRTRPGA